MSSTDGDSSEHTVGAHIPAVRSLGIFPSMGSSFMAADYQLQASTHPRRHACLPSLNESEGQEGFKLVDAARRAPQFGALSSPGMLASSHEEDAAEGAGAHKQGLFGGSKALLAKRHSLPAGTLRDKASSSAVPQATDANKPAAPSSKQLQAQQHSLPAGTLREKVSGGGIERALVPSRSSHVPRGNASAPHFTLSLDVLNNQTSVEASLSGDGHVQSLAVPSPQS